MFPTSPMLHLLCGKPASGKSTLAAELALGSGAIVISEDEWLEALFADDMASLSDYVRCAAKLRRIMEPHVATLLTAGVSVVLDFPANTIETRGWMQRLLQQTNAAHRLHVLDVPDEVCLARLQTRNARDEHPFAATEVQFRRIARHYVAPRDEEGFNVVTHRIGDD
ncbi:putative kinase [Aliiruegeria haliotis]|uniref:Putative kinase n=1 Tax=Aliiruegeria haliotis TaxID=1280846 RepID=A0A2T0RYZ3_9RHOB|nr:ATP-binding protein [Aliiruegeria haliotis]PRY26370.1 putative kinase [Aliiruegeria haliotis]